MKFTYVGRFNENIACNNNLPRMPYSVCTVILRIGSEYENVKDVKCKRRQKTQLFFQTNIID